MSVGSSLVKVGRAVWKAGCKHAPTIAVIFAGVATAAAIVTAIQATPACNEELEKEGLGDPEVRREHVLDCAKIYAKHYWKTAALGVGGALLNVFADREHVRRETAIAAGGQLAAMSLHGLEQAIVDDGGEKKLEKYRDKAAQAELQKIDSPLPQKKDGSAVIIDSLSNQVVPLTAEEIRQRENDAKRLLETDHTDLTLNEWLYMLHVNDLPFGEDLIFEATEYEGQHTRFGLHFAPGETANRELCWMIVYNTNPEPRETFR